MNSKLSLQECLASRKDCSGKGRSLPKDDILDICRSTNQAAPSRSLFIVLPDGKDYTGGIYSYKNNELTLITDEEKTQYIMELYPELIDKEKIPLDDLIQVGLIWQYLSLKVESMGFGISQRARSPKKFNALINEKLNENHNFLYSVAVRERDREGLVEDTLEPPKVNAKENSVLLNIPSCYEDRKIYKNEYNGIPLDSAIFNQVEKKSPEFSTLHEISQLLWACEGETDHATHGNRDTLEKNGYGRVHASGCAGYAVYPIVIVENLANLQKGLYLYNPIGYSALNRWIKVDNKVYYDHFLQKFSSNLLKDKIEENIGVNFTRFTILLCIDRKKPCSGLFHKVIMNTESWAEIEAGMALSGLQLQANALGLKWQKKVISNPDDPKYRELFHLESAEKEINKMAENLINLAKNERLSLEGNLVPTVLFSLQI